MKKTLRETVNENLKNNKRTLVITYNKEIFPIASVYTENTNFIIIETFHHKINSSKILLYTNDIDRIETVIM